MAEGDALRVSAIIGRVMQFPERPAEGAGKVNVRLAAGSHFIPV